MSEYKAYIGLSVKQRLKIVKHVLVTTWKILWIKINPQNAIEIHRRLAFVDAAMMVSLSPSPEILKEEISKRPFEPFGVPGWINTFGKDEPREKNGPK